VKMPETRDKPFRAVFIHAPIIEKVRSDSKAWSEYRSTIIGAKRNVLALTFRPEQSNDLRIHEYFLTMTRRQCGRSGFIPRR
jgi:5'-phosphate synthase pdxT subunit